jgi:cellobiose transport system permease protein
MQAVPKELYEAATLDGATPSQQLRRITLPMIRPTLIFTVIISTIYGMQIFAEPQVFAGSNAGALSGGNARQFQTLTLYLVENGFSKGFQFGYASAVAWVMFLLIIIFALINYVLVRRVRSSS